MSTIKVTNIQATGETGTRAVSGVTAVWISDETLKVDTAGVWTGDSLNVSSVEDQTTGQALVNFSSGFSNTGFCSHATGSGFSTNDNGTTKYGNVTANRDTVYLFDTAYKDGPFCYSALGDLA